jgi:FixJ family two-component response regulator
MGCACRRRPDPVAGLQALEPEALWFAWAMRLYAIGALWERIAPRQREIASMVAGGDMNKSIGWDLNIHFRTVEEYRKNLRANLGFKSAPELAKLLAQM